MSPVKLHDDVIQRLRQAAEDARDRSYPRYSGFFVVAAVKTIDDRYYGGANVEVVNYTLSKHAEEVAILAAISDGVLGRCGRKWLQALYVIESPPCGSCRQFAWEWAAEDARCVVDHPDQGTRDDCPLVDWLPRPFSPETLPDRSGKYP